ncbi:cytochrome c3 family protein [Desulfacinum hydrothermale]|uniref:cytochrome c3 family protein n=1 Tax=Desulfacinum hydrothermale TaxID=109258 RepID=UPI003CCBAAA7
MTALEPTWGGEEQKCSTCHTAVADGNAVPLKRAFHLQCKSCDERLNSREGMNLPVMCGQCHKP